MKRTIKGMLAGCTLLVLVTMTGCQLQEGDFVGSWILTDPNRTYEVYHCFMDLLPDGTLTYNEYYWGLLLGSGYGEWSYEDGEFWMISDYNAEFSGEVDWASDHFRVTGYWSNGTPGTIDFERDGAKSYEPLTIESPEVEVPAEFNSLSW